MRVSVDGGFRCMVRSRGRQERANSVRRESDLWQEAEGEIDVVFDDEGSLEGCG